MAQNEPVSLMWAEVNYQQMTRNATSLFCFEAVLPKVTMQKHTWTKQSFHLTRRHRKIIIIVLFATLYNTTIVWPLCCLQSFSITFVFIIACYYITLKWQKRKKNLQPSMFEPVTARHEKTQTSSLLVLLFNFHSDQTVDY